VAKMEDETAFREADPGAGGRLEGPVSTTRHGPAHRLHRRALVQIRGASSGAAGQAAQKPVTSTGTRLFVVELFPS
jgi:hypothetical protein